MGKSGEEWDRGIERGIESGIKKGKAGESVVRLDRGQIKCSSYDISLTLLSSA